MAVTPLHLATAYAAIVNGGIWRPATLEKRDAARVPEGRRVFSEATSRQMRSLMRLVVLDGTGRKADAPGYRVGGTTGHAETARAAGYARNGQVAAIAGALPVALGREDVWGKGGERGAM